MIEITKENRELFECGFLCPKCGCDTNTFRHPWAKRWCPYCGFVLREEGDSSNYDYKQHLTTALTSTS